MLDYQFNNGQLSLSGQLRVQYLDILREALESAMSQAPPVRLDLSQVREVDLAGLQLLTAWLQDDACPRAVLAGLPGVVERALELSGLNRNLAPYLE
ncbi:MAG: STAS domain-containing protein [Desulfarculaceae bacterium]|nr:STAS domain-containing protein [Desulfarculaceae bacterium]